MNSNTRILNTAPSETVPWHRRAPWYILITGLVLIIYMVTSEGEPGALPLLLILTGTAWLLVNRRRSRSSGRRSK